MSFFIHFEMELLRQRIKDAERDADEKYLGRMLELSPPESHEQIKRDHAAYIERRRLERETERRHQELCSAIRSAGRYSW